MLSIEIIAFEVVTLAAARISATHLAANSILQSLCVIMFTIPFPVSIAGGTRMANLIGASLPDAARVTSNVLFVVGAILGTCNVIILYSGRSYIPYLYTHDSDVAELAAATLPINAAFQLFDAIAAQCNGMLRGLGKQKIGGYVSLFSFYGVSCPSGVSERAARLTSTSNNLARTPRLLRYRVRPWVGPHWPVVRTGNRVVCAGHIGIHLRLEDELPEGQRGCC